MLLPGKLWEDTWDPEGILSTLPSVATGIMGMISGYILLGKEDLYVPGDQGLNSVELINTMILSGLDKKEIELPLNEEEYENKLREMIGNN